MREVTENRIALTFIGHANMYERCDRYKTDEICVTIVFDHPTNDFKNM